MLPLIGQSDPTEKLNTLDVYLKHQQVSYDTAVGNEGMKRYMITSYCNGPVERKRNKGMSTPRV